MDQPTHIDLGGQRYPLFKPDFATTEEVLQQLIAADRSGHDEAIVGRVNRTRAAVIGVCTQLGERAGTSWIKSGCNALTFGGAVYSHLRAKGVGQQEILDAATAILPWFMECVFPRGKEVDEKVRFFEGGGGDSNGRPSP